MPTITVAPGCISAPLAVPARSIVTVSPAAGATGVLEYTADSLSDITNGVARWASWPKGASNSPQQDIINEPAFLRLTALGGPVTLTTEESPTIMARENFNADWGGSKRYPYILAQKATPIILLSSATNISATGAITGLTALPYQPSGVVQVYCFAQAGLAAGLYYATFSSTSACQLYTDAAGTITPTGITAGAYNGGTTEVTLMSVTVPGNSLGANGMLATEGLIQATSPTNANTKTVFTKFAASTFGGTAVTNSVSAGFRAAMRNRGSGRQVSALSGRADWTQSSSGAATQFSVDSTVDQVCTITGQLSVASDYIILEGYTVEVLPA